jgi:hypothetical protein
LFGVELKIARHSLALLVTLLLAACTLDIPSIQAAEATQARTGPSGTFVRQRWELDARQVQEITLWLKNHSSGWSTSVASYSGGSPYVRITHNNGDTTSIGILSPTEVLVVHDREQYVQRFEEADVRNLLSAIGAPDA